MNKSDRDTLNRCISEAHDAIAHTSVDIDVNVISAIEELLSAIRIISKELASLDKAAHATD